QGLGAGRRPARPAPGRRDHHRGLAGRCPVASGRYALMAGNSKRRGAVRKPGSKKGPQVGSGGQRRRALKGRGPTPKAEDRPYHPAAKKAAAERRSDQRGERRGEQRPPRRMQQQRSAADFEIVAGRNAVVEADRAGVPVEKVYLASRSESDERLGEGLRPVTARHLPLVEATRSELDRLTDGANHQGIAVQVPPYEYADPAALLDRAKGGPPLVVALDGVTDPHNLGAVPRSAAAVGVHG